MTPATPRSSRLFTRLCYGLLWVGPVAILAGLTVAIGHTVGAVVTGLVVAVVLWRLVRVGLYADERQLLIRTVTNNRVVSWDEVESLSWRAPRILGGVSTEGLDTRNARLSLRRKDGSEVRLPVMVWSPTGAERVRESLRQWTAPAGVVVVPLVERDLRPPR